MPVPLQRDPARTRDVLAAWCSARLGARVGVGALEIPRGQGFGNETVLFEASWTGGHERLVARIAASTYQVYPEVRFAEQYRLLEILGEKGIPVPRGFGFEPDPGLLGAPFFVMSRVDGRVPADLPSYHRSGWVASLAETDQEALWYNGIDALAAIHRLDPATFGFLAGDDLLEHYATRLDFFGVADDGVVGRALSWLRSYRPQWTNSALLWGDARLGNLIFDGVSVAGVLDWEMAQLGPPEADLAWFLYLDRHLSEGVGASRLPGLPSRAETIARYEAGTGRPVGDLGYFEVLAGFRFALITARVTELLRRQEVVPADFPLHRNAVALLARTLDELTVSY